MSSHHGLETGRPLLAVLLAGGKGTRFWPASRAANPKQFLKLAGDRSLLRLTFERFARLLPVDRILVVTSPVYAERTRADLPELIRENLILEPSGRDTAPAAALAARISLLRETDPVLLVAPTDHFIQDEAAFAGALAVGVRAAETDCLVTFGVVPDRPATGYGYIEVGQQGVTDQPLPVLRFREKPGAPEAAAFLATGRFYWNAGIFAWRARIFEQELAISSPAVAAAIAALPPQAEPWGKGFEELSRAWERVPAISVDYALMEKAPNVVVVPLSAGWSDVGGWEAVRDLMTLDDAGNAVVEDALYVGARDCSVHRQSAAGTSSKEGRRLYALVETEGLIVVETADAVLITRKGAGETLREVVKRLAAAGRQDLL